MTGTFLRDKQFGLVSAGKRLFRVTDEKQFPRLKFQLNSRSEPHILIRTDNAICLFLENEVQLRVGPT
jgi:hypothetical protein